MMLVIQIESLLFNQKKGEEVIGAENQEIYNCNNWLRVFDLVWSPLSLGSLKRTFYNLFLVFLSQNIQVEALVLNICAKRTRKVRIRRGEWKRRGGQSGERRWNLNHNKLSDPWELFFLLGAEGAKMELIENMWISSHSSERCFVSRCVPNN